MSADLDKVVVFDGHCNLCQRVVQELLMRDSHRVLHFTALTSEYSRQRGWSQEVNAFAAEGPQSILYFRGGALHRESTAAAWIAWDLGGAYRGLSVGMRLIPRFIRDGIYRFIARHRYGWFGKTENCWLPRPQWTARFLK